MSTLQATYFLILNDREIEYPLMVLPAGWAILDGRMSIRRN